MKDFSFIKKYKKNKKKPKKQTDLHTNTEKQSKPPTYVERKPEHSSASLITDDKTNIIIK